MVTNGRSEDKVLYHQAGVLHPTTNTDRPARWLRLRVKVGFQRVNYYRSCISGMCTYGTHMVKCQSILDTYVMSCDGNQAALTPSASWCQAAWLPWFFSTTRQLDPAQHTQSLL